VSQTIPTGTLPGFPELTPAEQIAFDRMKEAIRATYERFGFAPVETPAVERPEVLFAKEGGETSRQVYRLEHEGMALRFDHTVPLARFVAAHRHELAFPFRRYAIGKVWRGERAQKGRFREFYQCDIDAVGQGALDLAHDAEVIATISAAFDALAVGDVVFRVSNRKLLAGAARAAGAGDAAAVLRAVDKVDKIGVDAARELLAGEGVGAETLDRIFAVAAVAGAPAEAIAALRALGIDDPVFAEGLDELGRVAALAVELGVPASRLRVDASIARGLDYYTGTVFETALAAHPELGSVCSGGRYDNLAEAYAGAALPGVGASIGLSRLFAQLRDAGLVSGGASSPALALVVPLGEDRGPALAAAAALRAASVPTEVYLEPKKAKNAFAHADRQGIPVAVAVGEREAAAGTCTVKSLRTGEQREVPLAELAEAVRAAARG
jgi:histidyl-tRNA synthetase